MDLSQQLAAEQRRLQERSQLAHLQGQVDELRHLLEQVGARAQLASEQTRQVQDLFSQLEARFEALLGEARLQEQARQRTQQALQKEVAELRVRVEEPARQILSLAAQVQDLQDGLRLLREQLARGEEGDRALEKRLEEMRAQVLLGEERLARLDALLGQMAQAEEERQRSIRQIREQVEEERQNLRRQAGEVDRLAAELRGEVQEVLSRLNRQAELQRKTEAALATLGERLDNIGLDRLMAEVQRVEREAVEHFLQNQEHIEALRQASQREWNELREAEERRNESQNAWLRRIEELYHDLDTRLARRDEEMGRWLTRLEERIEAVEKASETMLRALQNLFQQQLQEWAEKRLQEAGPPEEKSAGQVSRETGR
jgi:chromosome segregation ATPase